MFRHNINRNENKEYNYATYKENNTDARRATYVDRKH
jgi:hypothetical protein